MCQSLKQCVSTSAFVGPCNMAVRLTVLLILVAGGPEISAAQSGEGDSFCQSDVGSDVDLRGLQVVYCAEGPVTVPLQGADASARAVFYGAAPLAWTVGLIRTGTGLAEAYRLTVTQGATYGTVLALKRAVGRPRPYLTLGLESRSSHFRRSEGDGYTSFPSGHAALSAALATSWGLSYPHWYVVGPGAAWAVGVGLSRLYVGVHYPSDVLVGAVLGAVVAGAVHHLRGALTPSRFRRRGDTSSMGLPVGIRLQF